MKKIINHLREQPEHVRRHILHVSTIVFGLILAFLWVYSLGTNLTSSNTQTKMTQDLKPFSALTANMIGGYNSITEPNVNTEQ
ncbi:MAG: hypothetical protein WCP17_00075 [bacterium]